MTKFFKYLIFPVILLMVISGCVKDKYEPVVTNNQCDTTYYAREIKPILEANCSISGCHDGHQSIPNFNSFIELKEVIEEDNNGESEFLYRLDLPMNDPLHMPVDGRLKHNDKEKLEDWIDNGYVGC